MRKSFEYNGFHFTPFLQTESIFRAGEQIPLIFDHGNTLDIADFSYRDFFKIPQAKKVDVFRCRETGKLYIPTGATCVNLT